MSDKIPGVPEGWELVRIGKPEIGEWFIDGLSEPYQAIDDDHFHGCAIIRKIEKPATYRPFANAREADQFWNASLRIANSIPESKDSRFRINTIGCDGITIGLEFYSYKAAFDGFYVDDDGTPFGVRIDE